MKYIKAQEKSVVESIIFSFDNNNKNEMNTKKSL